MILAKPSAVQDGAFLSAQTTTISAGVKVALALPGSTWAAREQSLPLLMGFAGDCYARASAACPHSLQI